VRQWPGPLRFTELFQRLDGISRQVLSRTLQGMERDGLVTRRVYAEVPPRVEYSLTDLGHGLCVAFRPLIEWVQANAAAVTAARRRYDGQRIRELD
jgi:DNA-binding HxlR family transcriptional regulator